MQTRSVLSFCYLNIRSILASRNIGVSRLDVLYNFCCRDNDFDIILLTETHLDDFIDLSEISFYGYQLFVKKTDQIRRGRSYRCKKLPISHFMY